jgi:hypothetical protein
LEAQYHERLNPHPPSSIDLEMNVEIGRITLKETFFVFDNSMKFGVM